MIPRRQLFRSIAGKISQGHTPPEAVPYGTLDGFLPVMLLHSQATGI